MMKDEFYETFSEEDFSGHNERSIINTRDRLVHARKRKFLSGAFFLKSVVNVDPIVHEVNLKLIIKLDELCIPGFPEYPNAPKSGLINLYKWINVFNYDAIGEIAFGKSFGFLDMGNDIGTAETGDGKQYKTHIVPTFQHNSYYDVLCACWTPLIYQIKK
jgi:benzoate 4-monooxygenase